MVRPRIQGRRTVDCTLRRARFEALETRQMLSGGPLSLDGFVDQVVIDSGVSLALSLAFFPDGRMLVLQKDGKIWIADPNTGAKSVYMQLANIDKASEKGLLDITLAPDFDPSAPGDDFFYVYYTPLAPQFARIARFLHLENGGGLTSRGSLASEFEVWRDTDSYLTCCHYGGGLDFGPDGKLWLTSSDKFTSPTPGEGGPTNNLSQDLTRAGGKVIRVNPDGSAPDGTDGWPANPFTDPIDDDPHLPGDQDYYDYIWAYGLRNPFRARWDLPSGRFLIGEVGGNQHVLSHEDVHAATLGLPAANYGWPYYEGTPRVEVLDPLGVYAPQHGFAPIDPIDPIFSYAHNGGGASITGGEVYRGNQFPSAWQGVYFYGDYTNDVIRYVTFDDRGAPNGDFDLKPTSKIPGVASQVVFVGVGVDGALYYIEFLGDIRRITHASANQAPQITSASVNRTAGPFPLNVTFTAQVSDPENDALSATWRFGDGTSSSSSVAGGNASAVHTYATTGLYSAYLEVNDGAHTSVSQVFSILVGDVNLAPHIQSIDASPAIGNPPLPTTFSAQVSDPNHDALTYQWFFGDGASSAILPVPSSGAIATSHVFSQVGAFDAYLRVNDGSLDAIEFAPTVTSGVVSAPPITNGLVMLLEADIKVAVSSGTNVAAWLDGSGHGNNLVATGDPQIQFGATPGGLPAVAFDGDGDRVARAASEGINDFPTGNQDRTLLAVVNYVDTRGFAGGATYGGTEHNGAFGLVADGPTGRFAVATGEAAGPLTSSIVAAGTGWALQSVVVEAGNFTHYRNQTVIDAGTHAFQTDLSAIGSRIVLGEAIDGSGFSELDVAAVLVYDRALGATELRQIEAYLFQKYFVGNLPPLAGDDEALVANGAVVSIDALANDLDIDGVLNPAQLAIIAPPAHGSLAIDPISGLLTYRHDGSPGVFDQFTYTIADETSATSNAASVSVHIGEGSIVSDGLALLLESDAGVAIGTGGVAGWLDASGNGNDLQAASGSPQWTLAATPTGMAALTFDGNDSLSRAHAIDPLNNVPIDAADRTLSLVVRYDGPGPGFAYGASGANHAFGAAAVGPDGKLAVVTGALGSEIDSSTIGVGAGWIVETIVVSSGRLRHYVNGELVDVDLHAFSTQLGRLVVGADAAGSSFGDLDLAAVLLYDRALTDAERQQTEARLQSKYLHSPPTAGVPGAPVLALDAMSDVEIDLHGAVSVWGDLSARRNDVFATSDQRPTLIPGATPNGSDAVRFDGDANRLQRTFEDGLSGLPDSNGSRSLFLVAQFRNATGAGGVAFGDRFDNQVYGLGVAPSGVDHGQIVLQGWGQRNDLVTDVQGFVPESGESTGWMLLSAIHTNDGNDPAWNSFVYQNGALISGFDHQYNTDVHNSTALLTLGQEIGGLDHIGFDVAAVLVYDKALTPLEQLEVEDYLRQRYLGANLPPHFLENPQLNLDENTSDAMRLKAVDPEGQPIVYSIAGGPDAALFTLEGPLGNQLRLTTPPDFESPRDADADNVYRVRVRASDGIGSQTVDATFTVQDVDLGGPTFVNEGSHFTLAIDDLIDRVMHPGASLGIDWGDGGTLDIYSPATLPLNVMHHYLDDAGPIAIRAMQVDANGIATLASKEIEVRGVAPTVVSTFAARVDEGSPGLVQMLLPFDPSSADVDAGLLFSYDFDDDGTFDVVDSPNATAVVPARYLFDDPGRTTRARIADKEGLFTDYWIDVPVDNVAPVVAAGPDAVADADVTYTRTVAFSDPGADGPWTVRIDWNGDGLVDQTTTASQRTLEISYIYAATEIGNTYTVRVEVDDADMHDGVRGVGVDTFQVHVVANTLRVVEFTPEPSGFAARFNRALAREELNLYGTAQKGQPLAPPDVRLIGSANGPIRGSLLWNDATHTLRFVKTGGPLAMDQYDVVLTSGAHAFVDALGELLDGDANHIPGGDFVRQFSVSQAASWVGVSDFARGPGQLVDLTPQTALDAALPLIVHNVADLLSIEVDVLYDPALIKPLPTAAFLDAGASAASWTLAVNAEEAGVVRLSAAGTSPLSGPQIAPINLAFVVDNNAPYGTFGRLQLANLTLNEGALVAVADAAVMAVAYVGDVDLSGGYTAYDAASIARIAVGVDTGFASLAGVDPVLVADASGNGFYSSFDASLVAQKATGLDVPLIPQVPWTPEATRLASGPAVELKIGHARPTPPDQTFTVPVEIKAPAFAIGDQNIHSATFEVFYDEEALSLGAEDVTRGNFWTSADGWSMQLRHEPGVVHLAFYRAAPSSPGNGTLVDLRFHVLPQARVGDMAPLVLQQMEPHEGGLNWTSTSGAVQITLATDFSRDLQVDVADLTIWDKSFGSAAQATPVAGDANADARADGRDFLAWQREAGANVTPSPIVASIYSTGELSLPSAPWRAGPAMPHDRTEFSAVEYEGWIYAFGGIDGHTDGPNFVDAYHIETQTWHTNVTFLPTPRHHFNAVRYGEEVWIVGGKTGDDGTGVDRVDVYNLRNNSWRRGPDVPQVHWGGPAVVLGDMLHVLTGAIVTNKSTTHHYALDLQLESAGWQQLADVPEARVHVAAVALGGEIYLIGGELHHFHEQDRVEVQIYNPATDRWRYGASLPQVRSHIEWSTFVYRGEIWVVAGVDSGRTPRGNDEIFIYNPQTLSWRTYNIATPANLVSPAALVVDQELFVMGGGVDDWFDGTLRDVWILDVALPAQPDFDQDGDVDGRDFLTWQRAHGSSGHLVRLQDGDTDLSSTVDAVDLLAWERSFGLAVADVSPGVAPPRILDAGTALLAWQRGLGTAGSWLSVSLGDLDDNRVVDGLDLAIWSSSYGERAEVVFSAAQAPSRENAASNASAGDEIEDLVRRCTFRPTLRSRHNASLAARDDALAR